MRGLQHNKWRLLLASSLVLLAACGEPPSTTPNNSAAVSARIERTHPYVEPYAAADTPVETTAPVAPLAGDRLPRIAIIIDDLGNHRQHGLATIALPGAVTVSIMPHTPFAHSLADAAHDSGKEVMLHMPMSNVSDQFNVNDTLTPEMTRETFSQVLLAAMDSVPHATGLNNHTGSELTAMDQPMRWLMEDIDRRGWFFIDSRTTAESVAAQQAAAAGIPYASRNIFLDHEINRDAIDAAFRKLLHVARAQGQAIGIGHPHPETIAYLNEAIGYLPALGIELVPASELLHTTGENPAGDLQESAQHGTLAQHTFHDQGGSHKP